MRVLVTGGAGYIGSHAVRELIDRGHEVIVLDNLMTGHRAAVNAKATFIEGNIGDFAIVSGVFNTYEIDAVMHFAAHIEVNESTLDPAKYYENNVVNSIRLLQAMKANNLRKIIFSSTAAIYGNPKEIPITEAAEIRPVNPYGRTKMMVEAIIHDFCAAYGMGYVIMRYFNVAGASPDATLGEAHEPESHLIPRILKAALNTAAEAKIFGTDYNTPDGTCIRDYIHVMDLANAHVLALEDMSPHQGVIYNIGSESGFSVREVFKACEEVSGKKITIKEETRRAGDPAILVASSRKIKSSLGWVPKYPSLKEIINHAWQWHATHPNGYDSSRQSFSTINRAPFLKVR